MNRFSLFLLLIALILPVFPARADMGGGLFNPSPSSSNPVIYTTFVCDGTDQTAAIQAILRLGGNYYFTGGICKTGSLSATGVTLRIKFAPDTVLEPASRIDIQWALNNDLVWFDQFNVEGNGLVEQPVKMTGGDFMGGHFIENNVGYSDITATDLVAGITFTDFLDGHHLEHLNMIATNFNSIGNGTCGDAIGQVRAVYYQRIAFPWEIDYVYASGFTGTEDDDFIFNQLGTQGGVIQHFVARYNGNTRRILKSQSGDVTVVNADWREGADFVPVSGSTQIGLYNLDAVAFATTGPGSVRVLSGTMDCTGFSTCSTGASIGPGVIMIGPTLDAIRPSTACNTSLNQGVVGLFAALNAPTDKPTGITGATIINFGRPIILQAPNSYAVNNRLIDPVDDAGEINSSGAAQDNLNYSDNTITTITPGYLNNTRIVQIGNVTNLKMNGNRLIEQGNTTHAARFLDLTSASATGYANFNDAPSGTTPVTDFLNSSVFIQLSNSLLGQWGAMLANVNSTSATLGSLTALSENVISGHIYHFRIQLFFTADAVGGYQYSIGGGTATATSIIWYAKTICNATSAYTMSSVQTTLAAAATATPGCVAGETTLEGDFTASANGTFVPQFAQNTASGTSTAKTGSTIQLTRIN